jgi:hypothetical protein
MVNVCLRRWGCDRIVVYECNYGGLLFLFTTFIFVTNAVRTENICLFVSDRKYGKVSFVNRINENLVLIFIVTRANIFLHKCERRNLPIYGRWSLILFLMHIPTTKILNDVRFSWLYCKV